MHAHFNTSFDKLENVRMKKWWLYIKPKYHNYIQNSLQRSFTLYVQKELKQSEVTPKHLF